MGLKEPARCAEDDCYHSEPAEPRPARALVRRWRSLLAESCGTEAGARSSARVRELQAASSGRIRRGRSGQSACRLGSSSLSSAPSSEAHGLACSPTADALGLSAEFLRGRSRPARRRAGPGRGSGPVEGAGQRAALGRLAESCSSVRCRLGSLLTRHLCGSRSEQPIQESLLRTVLHAARTTDPRSRARSPAAARAKLAGNASAGLAHGEPRVGAPQAGRGSRLTPRTLRGRLDVRHVQNRAALAALGRSRRTQRPSRRSRRGARGALAESSLRVRAAPSEGECGASALALPRTDSVQVFRTRACGVGLAEEGTRRRAAPPALSRPSKVGTHA